MHHMAVENMAIEYTIDYAFFGCTLGFAFEVVYQLSTSKALQFD